MSWITRCPDCDTVYKVESEQLQQAHGWLRCGTCQHVFDSAGRVVAADVIPTLTERVNVGAPQLGRVDVERLLHKESPTPVTALPEAPSVAQKTPEGVAPPVPAEPSPISAFEDALQSFKLPDWPAAAAGRADEALEGDAAERAPAAASAPALEPAPAPAPARRTSQVVWAMGVMLLAGLAFQLLLASRSTWLLHWPQAGVWASQWCSSAQCRAQWQPPLSIWNLQAEPLVPDGSGYRLSWSLGHASSAALLVPELELALFNVQGQSVSSQHLAATTTAAPMSLAAGQVWQSTLHVELPADLDASRAELRLVPR